MSPSSRPFDERFLMHRLRSMSIASMAGITVAMGFFLYHWLAQHVWNWELLSIGIVMAAIKQGMMLWYRITN